MQAIGIPAADHAAGARLIAEPSVIDVAKKPVVWSAPTKQTKRNETKRPASFKHLNLNPKACDGWMDGWRFAFSFLSLIDFLKMNQLTT